MNSEGSKALADHLSHQNQGVLMTDNCHHDIIHNIRSQLSESGIPINTI